MFKQKIAEALAGELSEAEIKETLIAQTEEGKGDYSLPCFRFCKKLGVSPQVLAQSLKDKLNQGFIDRAECVGGYLNITIKKDEFVRQALLQATQPLESVGEGKTICIDYSSINIAKPFHIGHLSSTVIGGSLYKIFKRLGYNVVGINHLGDYGTQFGKLIYAFKAWSSEERLHKDGINELLSIYVKYHDEAEKNPKLDDEARSYFKKIEQGDGECVRLFKLFKDITLKEVGKTYQQLGVVFDSYNGESFFSDKMDEVVQLLQEKNLLKESEGALVVDLSEYGMPPCLIKRSDGASLYATRDIAAALYRKREYNFDKCLYVVAYQQNLHFKQVFKVLELMGMDFAGDLIHVPFGMVSLEDGTMSTRRGKVVFLQEILDRAVEKTLQTIEDKNPNLPNKQQVAEQVGRGAVIFSALANSRIKDVTFSYDRVLSFEGETGPYIQYTCARCSSVLARAGEGREADVNVSYLTDSASISLLKELLRYKHSVLLAAERLEPSILSNQLIDICKAFNRFYLDNKILSDNPDERRARLALTAATRNILKDGASLILLSTPEQM